MTSLFIDRIQRDTKSLCFGYLRGFFIELNEPLKKCAKQRSHLEMECTLDRCFTYARGTFLACRLTKTLPNDCPSQGVPTEHDGFLYAIYLFIYFFISLFLCYRIFSRKQPRSFYSRVSHILLEYNIR